MSTNQSQPLQLYRRRTTAPHPPQSRQSFVLSNSEKQDIAKQDIANAKVLYEHSKYCYWEEGCVLRSLIKNNLYELVRATLKAEGSIEDRQLGNPSEAFVLQGCSRHCLTIEFEHIGLCVTRVGMSLGLGETALKKIVISGFVKGYEWGDLLVTETWTSSPDELAFDIGLSHILKQLEGNFLASLRVEIFLDGANIHCVAHNVSINGFLTDFNSTAFERLSKKYYPVPLPLVRSIVGFSAPLRACDEIPKAAPPAPVLERRNIETQTDPPPEPIPMLPAVSEAPLEQTAARSIPQETAGSPGTSGDLTSAVVAMDSPEVRGGTGEGDSNGRTPVLLGHRPEPGRGSRFVRRGRSRSPRGAVVHAVPPRGERDGDIERIQTRVTSPQPPRSRSDDRGAQKPSRTSDSSRRLSKMDELKKQVTDWVVVSANREPRRSEFISSFLQFVSVNDADYEWDYPSVLDSIIQALCAALDCAHHHATPDKVEGVDDILTCITQNLVPASDFQAACQILSPQSLSCAYLMFIQSAFERVLPLCTPTPLPKLAKALRDLFVRWENVLAKIKANPKIRDSEHTLNFAQHLQEAGVKIAPVDSKNAAPPPAACADSFLESQVRAICNGFQFTMEEETRTICNVLGGSPHSTSDVQMEIEVHLSCPITSTRIRIPAKGINCTHLQCFDLMGFIALQSWLCPICKKEISVTNLCVSLYTERLLEQYKNIPGRDVRVLIHSDASYELRLPKAEARDEIEVEDD